MGIQHTRTTLIARSRKPVRCTEYTLSSFPHVLDSIVAGADETSLRSLLGVSKYLDGKARARLYKHISIQLHTFTGFRGNTYAGVELTSPQSGKRLPGLRWPSPHDPSLTYDDFQDTLGFTIERLEASTKVLDLGQDGWSEWQLLGLAEMEELSFAFTEVQVVRYWDTLTPFRCPLLQHIRSYDLITLKHPERPSYSSRLQRANLFRVIRIIPSVSRSGVELTDFLGPDFNCSNDNGGQPNQAYFTFLPPVTEHPGRMGAGELSEEIFQIIYHYIYPHGHDYEIHLVGLERFSSHFLRLGLSEDSSWSDRKIALLAWVKDILRPFIPSHFEGAEDLVEGLSDTMFLTIDEFQEMVGRESYAQSFWEFDDHMPPILPPLK